MNFDPGAALAAARRAGALATRRAEFGWKGSAPSPVEGGGTVVLKTSDPSHELAIDSPFDSQIGTVSRRFIPAFLAFATSKGVMGYQERVSTAMQSGGMSKEDSVILVRLSWVIIMSGLAGLCESLDRWTAEVGDGSPVPLAPLHLWALGEASACYLTHLDPTASAPPIAADAKFLEKYFGDYCVDFNSRFSPYTSLSIVGSQIAQR